MTLFNPETSGNSATEPGNAVIPKGILIIVIAMIPINNAPVTLYALKIAIIKIPNIVKKTAGSDKFPNLIPSEKSPSPEFLNPK